MNQPLISVIVPCYNVESYLNKCVESIINQTYKNLEIILVNDGSTDHVPEMCDAWAAKDSRIKVIHKINGGASSARNVGLDIANGDFICFADGDDWLEPTMYEELYNLYLDNRTDVCLCRGRMFMENSGVFVYPKGFTMRHFYDSDTYLRDMLLRKAGCAPWDKLYTRKFIGKSRFRNGRTNEDLLWLFERFYDNSFSVSFLDRYLYNYRKASNSVTTSKLNIHTFDAFYNCVEMEEYDANKGRKVSYEILLLKTHYAISEFWQIYKYKGKYLYYEQYCLISKHIKKMIGNILFSNRFSIREKIKSLFVLFY